MKNLPKEKRDRIILIALGAVTITVGLYYAVISSQRQTLVESAKKRGEQENKISSAETLISGLPLVEKNLEQATAQLRAIEDTMASGDMYSWVIQTVNAFKENYDVEIPQFSREVTTVVGMFPNFPYQAAVFHLRGSARYRDFGRFVADFENAFPYMRIQNIELEQATASAASAGGGGSDLKEKIAFKLEIVALVKP